MKALTFILCATMLGLWVAGCASQRDVLILDERLRAMERQSRELRQLHGALEQRIEAEVERFGDASQTVETDLRSQFAGMGAGMDRMQQELRLMGGRLEEVEHTLQRRLSDERVAAEPREQIDDTRLLVAQIERRLSAVENFLDIRPAPAPTETPRDAAAPLPMDDPALSDQELYARAKEAFDNGHMERARQGFQQFLKRFPQSDLANNAQFWIGETHYRERWFEKAILEYQTVIEKYPKGNKVPAAMLKQGMAFLQLGDEANARLVLRELQRKYPESSEAKVGTAKLNEL